MITHAGVALGKDSVYLPDHPITTNDLKTPDRLQTTDGETYELDDYSNGTWSQYYKYFRGKLSKSLAPILIYNIRSGA